MNEIHYLSLALVSLAVTHFLANLICQVKKIDFAADHGNRLGCIDGLRGYLALGVFFMHFMSTYYWKTTGNWTSIPEGYLASFGQAGVTLFFMITGYLFLFKILKEKKEQKPTDWKALYLSRIFRIYPLYIFAVALVFGVSFYMTGFELNTGFAGLIVQLMSWMAFLGGPVNEYESAKLVIAGVHWTLRYELLFYLSLPLLAFLIDRCRPLLYVLMAGIVLISVFPFQVSIINSLFFFFFLIGGVAAKIRILDPSWLKHIDNKATTIAAALCFIVAVAGFENSYGFLQTVILAGFFIPIALGNSMFGLLKKRASIFLGEISFSLYLMHGVVLFFTFTLLMPGLIAQMNYDNYLLLMPVVSAVVVLFSWLTYSLIEKPMIKFGKVVRDKMSGAVPQ